MSYQPSRQGGGGAGNGEGYVIGAVAGIVLLVVLDLWAATHLAWKFNHTAKPAANPFTIVTDTLHHTYRWPGAATVWAIGLAALVLALAATAGIVYYRRTARGRGIDRSARNVTRDRGIKRYSTNGKTKRAPGVYSGPGPVIGKVIPGAKRPCCNKLSGYGGSIV